MIFLSYKDEYVPVLFNIHVIVHIYMYLQQRKKNAAL